jgi:hypothetical protein
MGYLISIIDKNKSITQEIINECVKELPSRLFFDGKSRTYLKTNFDIHNSETNIRYLNISGSFTMSGDWALDMTLAMMLLLQNRGYNIKIYSLDFGFINRDLYEWLGHSARELDKMELFPYEEL